MVNLDNQKPNTKLIRDLTLSSQAPLSFCIRLLLTRLKWKGSISDFSRQLPRDPKELDIVDVRNILFSLGFKNKLERIETSLCKIKHTCLPAIYIDPSNHPCVLIEHDDGKIYGLSPGSKVELKDLLPGGKLLSITEAENISKLTLYAQILYKYSDKITNLYVASFIIALLSLSVPVYIRTIYNIVIPGQSLASGMFLFLGFIVLFIIEFNLRRWRSNLIFQLAGRLDSVIGLRILKQYLSLDFSRIKSLESNDYLNRIKSLDSLINYVDSQLVPALLDFPFIILYILFIAAIAGNLAMIPIALMLLSGIIVFIFSKFYEGAQKNSISSNIGIVRIQQEIINKFPAIKLSKLDWVWVNKFRAISAENTIAGLQINKQSGNLVILINLSAQLAGILTLSIGAYYVVDSQSQIRDGDLIAAMFIVWRIFGNFQALMNALLKASILTDQTSQIQNFLSIPSNNDPKNTVKYQQLFGSLRLISVSCKLPYTDYLLRNVSLDVKSGAICAITGKKKSGKSSILKVINQLYPITSGKILFDGVDQRQFNAENIQNFIASVSIKPYFMPGTLWSNLTLSNPDITYSQVKKICEDLNIFEFIEHLPESFNTIVNQDSTSSFPLGVLRMFSLAQAILKDSPIILIDDITLGMSPAQYDQIAELMPSLKFSQFTKKARTIIFTTTNNKFLRKADYFCVIDNGRSIFQGTEDELKSKIKRS